MAARKLSAAATGGRMLNPSVEPTARRESIQAKHDAEGNARRDSTGRASREKGARVEGASSADYVRQGTDPTASITALEARDHRRSIGLKRLSVTDHMKGTLIMALEGVARGVGMTTDNPGLGKLQDIMTEAKEKGLGVSKLFQFFLLQSDPTHLGDTGLVDQRESGVSSSPIAPENTTGTGDALDTGEGPTGGVFKETQSSKKRTEASRTSRSSKKKPLDLMPSLQKGKRPSTANSKRASGSNAHSAPGTQGEGDTTARDGVVGGFSASGRRSSMSRRSSSVEEAMIRDRQITSSSFQSGLTMLGFKLTDEEAGHMFKHLDANMDGKIDLTEFTRFCLEIPSMTWKAERVRRGILSSSPGVDANCELNKAARDMAHEAAIAIDEAEGWGGRGNAGKQGPPVSLGRVVYKGEKFFWRTKDLIEVVIQLNAKEGFMAISTFHTRTLRVYPIIFVDPAKIPIKASDVTERLKEMESKQMETRKAALLAGAWEEDDTANAGSPGEKDQGQGRQDGSQTLAEKAHMAYIADYLVHRIIMPDENGNILQPDVTQPGVKVNPGLPSDGRTEETERVVETSNSDVAKLRPGLAKTIFDEWDTLLFSTPPSRVEGAPTFPKIKKRESYLVEFLSKKEEFDENRIRAHRFSVEAAAYTEEVSALMRKLAPLNYSASAPAILHAPEADPLVDAELGARPGSGRLLLTDGISQAGAARRASARDSLLESQSAPVLPSLEQAGA